MFALNTWRPSLGSLNVEITSLETSILRKQKKDRFVESQNDKSGESAGSGDKGQQMFVLTKAYCLSPLGAESTQLAWLSVGKKTVNDY